MYSIYPSFTHDKNKPVGHHIKTFWEIRRLKILDILLIWIVNYHTPNYSLRFENKTLDKNKQYIVRFIVDFLIIGMCENWLTDYIFKLKRILKNWGWNLRYNLFCFDESKCHGLFFWKLNVQLDPIVTISTVEICLETRSTYKH